LVASKKLFLQRAFGETTIGVATVLGKAFDGMLGIVVVPRFADPSPTF
jgi:hypothetical protein